MFNARSLPKTLADLPDAPLIKADSTLILVGGGEVDLTQMQGFAENCPIIAVDGGIASVLAAGLKPSLLLGDFDSIQQADIPDDVPMLHITDQYSTDFEKALALISAPMVLGFGFLGKRLDHSLAALHALAGQYAHGPIVLIDPNDAVIFCRGEIALNLPASARCSIWPITTQKFIKSEGLRWPLDGLNLAVGKELGTSNQVVEGRGNQQVLIQGADEDDGYFILTMPENAPALIAAAGAAN